MSSNNQHLFFNMRIQFYHQYHHMFLFTSHVFRQVQSNCKKLHLLTLSLFPSHWPLRQLQINCCSTMQSRLQHKSYCINNHTPSLSDSQPLSPQASSLAISLISLLPTCKISLVPEHVLTIHLVIPRFFPKPHDESKLESKFDSDTSIKVKAPIKLWIPMIS